MDSMSCLLLYLGLIASQEEKERGHSFIPQAVGSAL